MMECSISVYQLLKDFAGPVATVIAAITAVSVTAYFAWHQKNIAKEQAFLAKEKLRHDLFDRRFKVFSSIFYFYEAIVGWKGTPEQIAARDRFFRAYQESVFLFKEESGVAALLKSLNDAGGKVIAFKENSEHYKADPELMLRLLNESTAIQTTVFDEGLTKLRAAMAEYLRFS